MKGVLYRLQVEAKYHKLCIPKKKAEHILSAVYTPVKYRTNKRQKLISFWENVLKEINSEGLQSFLHFFCH